MTPQQIEVHPEAFAEADAAVLWYAERSRHAAEEFLVELDNAIQSILEAPQRWPMFEEPFRRFPLIHFPYFVIYRETATNRIQILAVMHARRRPGYWKKRST